MKSIIRIEKIGEIIYVTLADQVLKSYDTYERPDYKAYRLAERYAARWIKKYWKNGGIIESYNEFNNLITREEY